MEQIKCLCPLCRAPITLWMRSRANGLGQWGGKCENCNREFYKPEIDFAEKVIAAALARIPHWHDKREGFPEEGTHDHLLLTPSGKVKTNIFYQQKHAAHDHSPWQVATHWLHKSELQNLPT